MKFKEIKKALTPVFHIVLNDTQSWQVVTDEKTKQRILNMLLNDNFKFIPVIETGETCKES